MSYSLYKYIGTFARGNILIQIYSDIPWCQNVHECHTLIWVPSICICAYICICIWVACICICSYIHICIWVPSICIFKKNIPVLLKGGPNVYSTKKNIYLSREAISQSISFVRHQPLLSSYKSIQSPLGIQAKVVTMFAFTRHRVKKLLKCCLSSAVLNEI